MEILWRNSGDCLINDEIRSVGEEKIEILWRNSRDRLAKNGALFLFFLNPRIRGPFLFSLESSHIGAFFMNWIPPTLPPQYID